MRDLSELPPYGGRFDHPSGGVDRRLAAFSSGAVGLRMRRFAVPQKRICVRAVVRTVRLF